MEPVTRRSFFKTAGAAAAVAGAVAIVPVGIGGAGASTKDEPELSASEDLAKGENLVAHVRNAKTGEISLFIGTREVALRDRKVAARLVRASR